MKTMLLPLSFLLLASFMKIFPEASASGTPVLDVKGLQLLPDVPYYLISSRWPIGGGVVSLGDAKNKTTCPVDVILREKYGATPVKISVANGQTVSSISGLTDVYLSFDTTSDCSKSTVWKHAKGSIGFTQFLTIGGVEGDVNTIFRIVRDGPSGFTYRIVAYELSAAASRPSDGLSVSIGDVGVSYDFSSGIRRLALTEPPLSFAFQVAESLKDM